jgi:hypothetical protein
MSKNILKESKEMVRQAQTEDKEVVQEAKPTRTKRVPFGAPRTKLDVANDIPGYHLHWVNDEGGRISDAQQGGYEFVKPAEVGKDGKEDQIKILVGKQDDGSGLYAYLMKIRMEWYEEDQQLALQAQDQFDDAIRKGTLEQSAGDNRYVPKGGIKIG